MIKKLTVLSSILVCGIASAQPNVCPFTDRFEISAPAQVVIKDLSSDGNLASSVVDDTHFTTSCDNFWIAKSGKAYLTIGNGIQTCKLTILDGPFESNPSILSVNCTEGLQYAGTDHVKNGKEYTLKFSA